MSAIPSSPKIRHYMLAMSLALSVMLFMPLLALADTITVTTTTDEFNTGANCSLREAIQAANTNGNYGGCTHSGITNSLDIIVLQPINTGIYTLTGAAGDNTNSQGDLDVRTDSAGVIISGTGVLSSDVVINANGIDRAIQSATNVALSLINVTIQNGNINTSGGGGVYFGGTARVTNTMFYSNTITGANSGGGAYFNNAATITGTTFMSNTTSNADGGGAYFNNTGTANVINTIFVSNTARGNNIGGGAYFNGIANVTSLPVMR